jgi:hypothetical protein
MSPVRYEMRFISQKDGILQSHRSENIKSYLFVISLVVVGSAHK